MLKLGQINKLKVDKIKDHGYYLDGGDEWGLILLPNKSAPKNINVDDELDVFVYFDSEDIIIATTQAPKAQVGDFKNLKVVANESVGVFLDWGIDKDLFVPHREQIFDLEVDNSYVFYTYIDSSQRIAATPRLNKHFSNETSNLKPEEAVELLIYQKTNLGYKAVINNKYSGLIFKDDTVNHLKLGQQITGFVKAIRSDGKVDLSLRPLLKESKKNITDRIIEELKKSNGTLNISSKSSAETINEMFNVSRKKFKIALGDLYKKKLISTDDQSIQLLQKK